MTFKTLQTISQIIDNDYADKESMLKFVKKQLSDFEDSNDIPWQYRERLDKVPEQFRGKYTTLVQDYNLAYSMFQTIQSAKLEFMQQDWR